MRWQPRRKPTTIADVAAGRHPGFELDPLAEAADIQAINDAYARDVAAAGDRYRAELEELKRRAEEDVAHARRFYAEEREREALWDAQDAATRDGEAE